MNVSLNKNTTTVAHVKLLIDGEWVESQTREWLDVINPATQEVLAKVPFATTAEVDAAVAAAQRGLQDLARHADWRAHAHHAQAAGIDS